MQTLLEQSQINLMEEDTFNLQIKNIITGLDELQNELGYAEQDVRREMQKGEGGW